MIGFVFAVLSAIAYGGLEGIKKKATESFGVHTIFWALVTFAIPFFTVAFIIDGIPTIDPIFWIAIAFDAPMLIFTNLLLIRTEKISPISTTLPLLSFTPVFLIFTSYVMLGELPSRFGLIGILLVVLGALLLKGEDLRKGFRNEVGKIFKSKGAQYILLIAFMWSFNANLSKIGINASSVWTYLFAITFIEAVFMNIWMYKHKKFSSVGLFSKKNRVLLYASLVNAVAVFLYLLAIEEILVSYVVTLKRAGFILGALLIGATIFKEKNIKYRIGGAALMLCGVVLILVLN